MTKDKNHQWKRKRHNYQRENEWVIINRLCHVNSWSLGEFYTNYQQDEDMRETAGASKMEE